MIAFAKLEATGNSFVISSSKLDSKPAKIAKEICDHNLGIGADGFVKLTPKSGNQFQWEFFNCDGSKAAMCGNAARAVACFIDAEFGARSGVILADNGPVEFQAKNHEYRVSWALPNLPVKEIEIDGRKAYWVDSGVPHVVVETQSVATERKNLAWIQKVKAEYEKTGINVTFYHKNSAKNEAEVLTHERGVENFTLSCGTGAIAVAKVLGINLKAHLPGGKLSVQFTGENVQLTGPARIIAKGEYFP